MAAALVLVTAREAPKVDAPSAVPGQGHDAAPPAVEGQGQGAAAPARAQKRSLLDRLMGRPAPDAAPDATKAGP